MAIFLQRFQLKNPEISIKENELLAPHTAFKSGGHAHWYAQVETIDHLIKIVLFARGEGIPVCVIGGGSNILVPHVGFPGLVIKNNCRRFELQGMKGTFTKNTLQLSHAYLYAEAGALTNQVVRFVVDQGFGGLECALGLPGTIGGALVVNANYVKENIRIGKNVFAAKILTEKGEIKDVDQHFLAFSFDTSSLYKNHAILLSAMFKLHPEDKKRLWEKATEAVTYRTTTQPKNLQGGMTFRNVRVVRMYPNSSLPDDVTPSFLLEKANLLGYRVGDAEISEVNPYYILNRGKATESDVEALISGMQQAVCKQFGVQLEMRPHVMA